MNKMIKPKITVRYLAIDYYIFVVLITGYVEHAVVWNVGALIIAGLLLINKRKKFHKNVYLLIVGAITGFLLILNILISDGHEATAANLRSISYSLAAIVSLLILENDKPGIVCSRLNKLFSLFNAFYIFNIYILFRQVKGTHLFIKNEWLTGNFSYKDMCSGFFGENSTNILGFFVVFMTVYNLNYADKVLKGRNKKIGLYVYILLTTLFMLYLFTLNDGNGLFLVLPMFLIIKIMFGTKNKAKNVVWKLLKYVGLVIAAIIIIYSIPSIRSYMNTTVVSKMMGILENRKNSSVKGSAERLAIFFYGLQNGWGWFLGKGIGYRKWHAQNVFTFHHFGMSSIGSFVNLMGIWFYLLYSCIYAELQMNLFLISSSRKVTRNKIKIYRIVTIGLIIVLSIYTYIFTEIRTTILLSFIILYIFNGGRYDESRNNLTG